MDTGRAPYCEDSARLGEGIPDLVGGLVGLVVGLTRGTLVAARTLVDEAIWMDGHSVYGGRRCSCVHHRFVVYDRGPSCR
jgi:hypothetical protein